MNPRWAVLAGLVLAALVLAGGNALGRPGLAVAVIAVQAGLTVSWLVLFRASVEAVIMVLAALIAADGWLLSSRNVSAGGVVGVLGLSVLAVLFHQLIRQEPRGANAAVAYVLGAIVAACAPALLLPLRELGGGRFVVYASVAAAGTALAIVHAPGPDLVRRLVALAIAGGVGACFTLPQGGLPAVDGLGVGLAAAGAALLIDRLFSRLGTPREAVTRAYSRALIGLAALLPLALASPIAYLAGRIIAPGAG